MLVAPEDYYLRINLLFEVAGERYHWLNRLIALGWGRKTDEGISYREFEVL